MRWIIALTMTVTITFCVIFEDCSPEIWVKSMQASTLTLIPAKLIKENLTQTDLFILLGFYC